MPIITELIKLFTHTVKYFAAIRKNEIEVNALIGGDSQDILLCGKSNLQNSTYSITCLH